MTVNEKLLPLRQDIPISFQETKGGVVNLFILVQAFKSIINLVIGHLLLVLPTPFETLILQPHLQLTLLTIHSQLIVYVIVVPLVRPQVA